MEFFQAPVCDVIIPPPTQFGDQLTKSLSSCLSWPAEGEARCAPEECTVKTTGVSDSAVQRALKSQTLEFTSSVLTQENSHFQKSSAKNEKLENIERLFDQHLQDCMSDYLKKHRTPPPSPLGHPSPPLNLPPPSPKSAMQPSPGSPVRYATFQKNE